MKWSVRVTDLGGRQDYFFFDEEPEQKWHGDVLRIYGAEEGRSQQLFVSVRSVLSVKVEEEPDGPGDDLRGRAGLLPGY